MDNSQMPQVQPIQAGQVPMSVQPAPQPQPVPKKSGHGDLLKVILIVTFVLTTITFAGLFVWKWLEYNDISTDVNGQIDTAVAKAKDEQATQDEAEFLEREKFPYKSFSGPADYGQLSFQYPKTWSVYVAADASKGGDFAAYFNPGQVDVVADTTLMALRVMIRDKDFETVASEYQKEVDAKDSNLKMESVTFNGITANKYSGTLPKTEFNGYIVIFKIRDKTAIIQTDSTLFENDYNTLLETVQFNA